MWMNKFLYVISLVGVMSGCSRHPAANEFEISGEFEKPFSGTVYLGHIDERFHYIDSVLLSGEKHFKFIRKIDNADCYRVVVRPEYIDCELFAEPGGFYHISLDAGKKECVLSAQNSVEQTLMDKYTASVDSLKMKSEQLSELYSEAYEKKNLDSLATLEKEIRANIEQTQRMTVDFIKACPKNYVAVHLTSNLFLNEYPQWNELYQLLDTVRFADTYAMRRVKEKITEAHSVWMQGQQAPDFTTKDVYGKSVSLQHFRGKYVLLDFWASWCRPCRNKAKELKNIYDSLACRGIAILGISFDEKKNEWMAATKEDKIIWTNTAELLPFKDNEIARAYKVKQLPTLFLIDPNGMIVKQNPSIGDLLALPEVKP